MVFRKQFDLDAALEINPVSTFAQVNLRLWADPTDRKASGLLRRARGVRRSDAYLEILFA